MFLEISQNSQENSCARVFFNKVACLRPATLFKNGLWYRCFPVNFANFIRILFLQNTFGWLFLLKLSQTSKMELYVKIINGFHPLTIFTKSPVLEFWQDSKYTSKIPVQSRQYKREINFSDWYGFLIYF